MPIQDIFLYIASFIGLWYGSGMIVDSIKRLARKIKIPPFAFSFFILGFLTSVPEIGVGLSALEAGRPEIFVGNLLGSIIVIFLLVIPLLVVISGGIKVEKHLPDRELMLTLGIIAVPALFALDGTVTSLEGFLMVALYIALFYIIRVKRGVLKRVEHMLAKEQHDLKHSTLLRLTLGVALLFFSSQYIVDQTIVFSEQLGVSIFLVSLVALGIGTNLPEIGLALRSMTNKAEDIALGDYLGSAAANGLIFGGLTLLNNGEVVTGQYFVITFLIITASLVAFYLMSRGKSYLTRKEGFVLLAAYAVFLIYEGRELLSGIE